MIKELVGFFGMIKFGYRTVKEIKKILEKGNLDKSSQDLVTAFERAFNKVMGFSIYALEYSPDNISDKIYVGTPNIICYILEYLNDPQNFTKTIIGNPKKYPELNIFSEVEITMIKEYFESELSNSKSKPYMIELLTQLRKDSIKQEEDHLKIDSKMNLVIEHIESLSQTNKQITDVKISKLKYESVDFYIKRRVRLISDKNNTISKYFGKLEPDDLYQELINEKRIILLASVGMGKTIELRQLAYYSSNSDETLWIIHKNLQYYCGEHKLIEFLDFNEIDKLPENKILLIFDGFDEIIERYKDSFIIALEQYINNNPKVHIVISSRFNFFEREELTGVDSIIGFKKFELLPLTQDQINQYIQNHSIVLPKADLGSDFWSIPFNLQILKEVQNEISSIKTKNDLLQIFLKQTIRKSKKDKGAKYRVFNPIVSYSDLIKVSFFMLINNMNFINEQELLELNLQKPKDIGLPGILEKNKDSGEYQFNHKNYQEYLSSQKLMVMSFDEIVQIATYEDNTLKPNFNNVLSLLMNEKFDCKNELIKFFIDNDSISLITFGYSEINENVKLKIFMQAFEESAENNQYHLFEGISENTINKFISSEIIENYLLDILENNKMENDHYRYLAIKVLSIISNPIDVERIRNILNEIFVTKNPKYKSLIYNAIWYLYDHNNQFDGDDIEKYILDLRDTRDLYSSVFSLIAKYEISERYIEDFIKIIKITMDKPKNDREAFQDHSFVLRKNFMQLNLDQLIYIHSKIDWVKHAYSYANYQDVILKAMFNISTGENKSKIFKTICELFKKDKLFSYNYNFDLILSYLVDSDQFVKLIEIFEDDENAFNLLINIADFVFKKDSIQSIDIEYFDTICKVMKLKPIETFSRLSNFGYDERVKEYSIKYPKQFNEYLKSKKTRNSHHEKMIEDIKNLFDKSYWENEIIHVFDHYGENITKKFYNYDLDFENKNISINIKKFINQAIREKKEINKNDALELFELNFENITMSFIYEKMHDLETRNPLDDTEKIDILKINDNVEEHVKKYCDKYIDKIEIRSSLKGGNSSFTINRITNMIEFFIVNFTFTYDFERMLDFLFFSLDLDKFNYFAEFCYSTNADTTKATINNILKSESQFALLRRNHLMFSKKFNLEFAKKFAIAELENEPFEDRFRFTEPKFAALAIINSEEHANELLKIFNIMIDRNDDFIPEFIEKMDIQILKSPKFIQALGRLSRKNISNSEHAAFKLISFNNPIGLEYLISSFQIGVKWYDRVRFNTPFVNVSESIMEPLMFKLFKMHIEGIIKNSDDFHYFIDALMIGYKNIMLLNKNTYSKIPKKLKNEILRIKDKSPRMYSNLYRQIIEIKKEGKDRFCKRE